MSSLYSLPPNNSSFSRPIGFLNDMSSPVPIAPCFPFRKTSAREVEGRRPFSSSRLDCLATSWRLPRVTISVCLGGVAGGRGSGFAALAFKFLGGMSLRRRRRCARLGHQRTGFPIIAPPAMHRVDRLINEINMCLATLLGRFVLLSPYLGPAGQVY